MTKSKLVNPPDELRCTRNDGKTWRCRNLRCYHSTYCKEHYYYNKKSRVSEKSKQKSKRMANKKKKEDEQFQSKTPIKKRTQGEGGAAGSASGLVEGKVKPRVCRGTKQRVSDDLQGTIRQTMDDDDDGDGDGDDDGYQCQTPKRRLEDVIKRCTDKSKLGASAEHVFELEKELEAYKTKCLDLSMELEKKKMEFGDLDSRKKYVETELKEWITSLKEDQKVVSQREKRAQERITYLEGELKTIERIRFDQLKRDIMDLDCRKRGEEDENEVWKKRFCELETRVLRMEEKKSKLRCMEPQVSEKSGLEPAGGLQTEVPHIFEGEKDREQTSKGQGETNGGTNSSHFAQLQSKEKVLNANERIVATAFAGSSHLPSLTGKRHVTVTGKPSMNLLCEPSINVGEKGKNTALESKVECSYKVRKQLGPALEGSSNESQPVFKLYSVRQASDVYTIEISDSDDSLETYPHKENDLTSKKCLKKICLDPKVEQNWSSCGEDLPCISIRNPKGALEIVTSESESENEVKLKKSRELKDGVPKHFPLSICSDTLDASYRCKNVEKKKGSADSKSHGKRTSPNQLKTSAITYEKVGKPTAEDGKDRKNILEEVGVDEWSGSSESSDSGDSSDSEAAKEAFGKAMAMLIRKSKELKWRFEADMLSSFEEDPELCMKAVCALYRQQTSGERSMNGVFQYNGRGFDEFDALRGTTLGKFLTDGDRKGDLKKSLKELEMFDTKALEDCQRLAKHYSEQLFTIYQNKEDPFFLPNSIGF